MVITRFSIIFIILVKVFSIHAQQMIWSEPIDNNSRLLYVDILLNDSDYSLIRSREPDLSEKLYIEKYNDTLNLISQTKIVPAKKEGLVVSYFDNNQEFWVFRSVYSLLDGFNILYLEKYTPLSSKPFYFKEVCRSALKNYGDKGDFLITRSEDKKNYLCYYTTVDDNGNDIVNLIMIDYTTKLIYNRTFNQIYQSNASELIQIECDYQQNAYLLYKEPDLLHANSNDFDRYKVAVFQPNENKLYLSMIDSGVHDIVDLYMTIQPQKNVMILGGFFNYKNKPGIGGSVYIRTSLPEAKIEVAAFNFLTDTFRIKALGERQFYINSTLKDYVIRHQIVRSDGSAVLMAERVFTNQQNYTYAGNGSMQTSYRTVYNFNEIVVITTNADGTIQWEQPIRKTQSTVNDGGIYSGFSWIVFSDRILFHFNKYDKGDYIVMEYALLNNGELFEREFLKSDKEDYTLIPSESKQVSASDMLFLVKKDNQKYILKASFPF